MKEKLVAYCAARDEVSRRLVKLDELANDLIGFDRDLLVDSAAELSAGIVAAGIADEFVAVVDRLLD